MSLFFTTLFVAFLLETHSPVVVVFNVKGQPDGAAVMVDGRGYLVTCLHVLAGREQVPIQLRDGSKFTARVIARQPRHDLALLKIDGAAGRHFRSVTLAKDPPRVREPVTAIGHPRGWLFSETAGIVSAVGRTVPWPGGGELVGLFQTDAPINAGNSGGALLNARGELLGIPVAVREGAQGIAFAVPASAIRELLEAHLPTIWPAAVGR